MSATWQPLAASEQLTRRSQHQSCHKIHIVALTFHLGQAKPQRETLATNRKESATKQVADSGWLATMHISTHGHLLELHQLELYHSSSVRLTATGVSDLTATPGAWLHICTPLCCKLLSTTTVAAGCCVSLLTHSNGNTCHLQNFKQSTQKHLDIETAAQSNSAAGTLPTANTMSRVTEMTAHHAYVFAG